MKQKSLSKTNLRIDTKPVYGVVDEASWERISGWAWYPSNPDCVVNVDFIVDGQVILSVAACHHRRDLLDAGKGHGDYAFSAKLPESLFLGYQTTVNVRDRSSGCDLEGSPFVLTASRAGIESYWRSVVQHITDSAIQAPRITKLNQEILFFLGLLDKLVKARAEISSSEEMFLSKWLQIFGPASTSEALAGLIRVAQHRYGDKPINFFPIENPGISIIIPVRNNYEYTYKCLLSILHYLPQRTFEIVLVDDGSSDETIIVPFLVNGIKIVRNTKSAGFVGAVSMGVEAARGKFIFLLNNDTEVRAGWLDELCDTLDRDAKIGVVGSKLLYPSGVLQECGGIIWRMGDGWNYGRNGDAEHSSYRYMRDADYVSGASLLIRRHIWDSVGGLSDEFAPGYYEDTDLCFKVREAGFRVVVQPASVVIHHEGVSSGTDTLGSGMKQYQHINMARFEAKWRDVLSRHSVCDPSRLIEEAHRKTKMHALVIDVTVPTPDRDAGSNACVEHIQSLQRLGYQVHFVSSDNMARISPYTDALEKIGVWCHVAPYEQSVEEVLRKSLGLFNVVYIHRVNNVHYLSLVRQYQHQALVIYSVADLHYLRLIREAEVKKDANIKAKAAKLRVEEFSAIESSDCTIVHSSVEASIIAKAMPNARVRVIPWSVRVRPTEIPFTARSGVAFIGSDHGPNIDAALWLVEEVMPLVWNRLPNLQLSLIGSHTYDARVEKAVSKLSVRTDNSSRIVTIGWLANLYDGLFTQRLTVAPLRYGAGLKGKILDSFAIGLPCVMTTVAAEGIDVDGDLADSIANEPLRFADIIERLHEDQQLNQNASKVAVLKVETCYSEGRIDALLAECLSEPFPSGLQRGLA